MESDLNYNGHDLMNINYEEHSTRHHKKRMEGIEQKIIHLEEFFKNRTVEEEKNINSTKMVLR